MIREKLFECQHKGQGSITAYYAGKAFCMSPTAFWKFCMLIAMQIKSMLHVLYTTQCSDMHIFQMHSVLINHAQIPKQILTANNEIEQYLILNYL